MSVARSCKLKASGLVVTKSNKMACGWWWEGMDGGNCRRICDEDI